jgi:hypothetical protein
MSSVSHPDRTIQIVFAAFFSWLSCHGFPVLAVLPRPFCPGCLSATVQSQLFCSSTNLSCSPVPPVLSLLSCPSCSVLSVLPRMTYQANLSKLTCTGCPVLLSHFRCPVLTVLSWLSCHGCLNLVSPAVLSRCSS